MTKDSFNFFELLFEKQAYLVANLLETKDFIKFCQDRGVEINEEMLERLDKLGVFHPVIRTQPPVVKPKMQFFWQKDLLDDHLHKGDIYKPSKDNFKPWSKYHNNGRKHTFSFYSKYQIYTLYKIIKSTTFKISALSWDSSSKEKTISILDYRQKNILPPSNIQSKTIEICQLIANKYQPLTMTNRRIYIVPDVAQLYPDDWFNLVGSIDIKKSEKELCIDKNILKDIYEKFIFGISNIDPLEKWQDLVSFINPAKRNELKGSALFAQTLYEMANMIRLFYADLYGEELPRPHEVSNLSERSLYGKKAIENKLSHLTYITNRYHLNPKPKVILFVEGHSEYKNIPILFHRITGSNLSTYGIEIQNLKGICNAGSKYNTKILSHFIDDHHTRQTVVYFILDNEGYIEETKEALINLSSLRRNKTKTVNDENFLIWNQSIEFDNFSDKEIAAALYKACNRKFNFSEKDVSKARRKFGRKGDPLSILYKKKTKRKLNKVKLLQILFEYIKINGSPKENRKIEEYLLKICDIAIQNHQPVNQKTAEENQQTGLLGNIDNQDNQKWHPDKSNSSQETEDS